MSKFEFESSDSSFPFLSSDAPNDDNSIDLSKIKFKKIFMVMTGVLIINIIFSFIIYMALYDEFSNAHHYIDFFYFGLVTISSTGYGDIIPITRRAKMIVSTYSLFIYSFMLSFTL